jgi:hypothetical protein
MDDKRNFHIGGYDSKIIKGTKKLFLPIKVKRKEIIKTLNQ